MAMGVDLDMAMVMARGHGVMGQEGMVHGGTGHGGKDQRNQRSKYPPVTGPLPSSLRAWSPLRLPLLLLWVSAPPGVAPELTSLLPWHLSTQGKNHLHKHQGSRKSKIGWELTKNGCHVRSPGLSKSHICAVFKLSISITVVFMHLFWAFRPIWLAISIFGSSFWLLDTYF